MKQILLVVVLIISLSAHSRIDTLVLNKDLTFLIEKENDIPIRQKDDYYFVRFSESLKIKIIYKRLA